MVDAFATYVDLGKKLHRTFTVDEQDWITELLGDASTYLREDVLGMQVYPQSQSTFTAWPDGGRVDLPQQPVVSVDAVTVDGVAVDYTRRDSTVFVRADDPVDIQFTYGLTTVPESLKRWACVLVSQVLIPLEQNLGLTVGGLSSVALDDFKLAFADAGEGTGISLSDRNIALIRRQFGSPGSNVVTLR